MTKKILGVMVIGLLAACGGGAAEGGGTTEVPAQYQGPVQSTDTATGEQVFNDVCGACHQGGDAPDLSAGSRNVGMIRMTVRQGTGQMPPLDQSRVSDEQLEAVLAYMQSIGAAAQ